MPFEGGREWFPSHMSLEMMITPFKTLIAACENPADCLSVETGGGGVTAVVSSTKYWGNLLFSSRLLRQVAFISFLQKYANE